MSKGVLSKLLAVALVCTAPVGAAPTKGSPAATAVTPALARFVAQKAGQTGLSGTVLIKVDGGRPWSRSFGLADRAFGVPVRPDTRFRAASITKLFTATMILMLAEERKLALDAPVSRYLPELRGGAARVTIEQLLNHTSGIAQYDRIKSLDQALTEGVPNYQKPLTAADLLHLCCAADLVAGPGSKFDYNNADYLLLGRVIERLDGGTFEQALKRRLLAPLRLADSGIARQADIIARLAPTYFLRPDTKQWMNDLPVYFENWDAAGAMYATPNDVATFAEALFGGRLLRPASLQRMLKPGLDDYGYGLWSYSFTRNGRSHRVAKRPGSIMGANAVLYRLIDQRVTIVILANSNAADLDEMAQRLAERLVGQVAAPSSS